ncbi:MAG: methylated-DNA--[protein]-cysteine S-methyltransferase [Xanthomonadales bacterium]|nr:methylated-DNA--[protein]-cysteine S-methyltransferase [Xanthomonadales bacterium]
MSKDHQFEIIHASIEWLAANQKQQPDLQALSQRTGYSPSYIQRVFLDWAGLSPKQFLQALTREAAVDRLIEGASSLETSMSVGFSSPGRLHDLLITTDALTPGEIKSKAKGIRMQYGFGQSPFGLTLVAWNQRGLSFLGFCHEKGKDQAEQELSKQWPDAELLFSPAESYKLIEDVFIGCSSKPIKLWLRGSPFQLKVWQALLAIPEGSHATYSQIAAYIGHDKAARATGSAIGANPIAWIIPCHRVIRKLGDMSGYRWGNSLKGALIGKELATQTQSA